MTAGNQGVQVQCLRDATNTSPVGPGPLTPSIAISKLLVFKSAMFLLPQFFSRYVHGEIIYGGTRRIEDDRSATFSEYFFLFPACLMISHWLTKNAELNSVF